MFMETMLRLRGRRSLAISWLHRRRMQAIDTLRRLYIVNPLAEEKLQGRAAYDVFKRGGTLFGTQEHRWSLSSHMPGVQKWPGVISTALAAAVIDIGVYFERKQAFWLQRKIQQRLMTEPIKRIA